MEPILSICIPTYNRAQYLSQAIESVVEQISPLLSDKIEICVSDNASTDNTKEIVERYMSKNICRITYHINEVNIGADKNFLKVIEIAKGKYCWWLGSDDQLEDNSLDRILSVLQERHSNFYLLSQNCYDKNMKKRFECGNHILPKSTDGFLELDDLLTDSILQLGYISVLIVKRLDFIKQTPLEQKYIGSCYIHTYKIMYELNNGKKIYFIKKPSVKWRSGNDSFLENLKFYERAKLDIEGYTSIASEIFGKNSLEYKKVINAVVVNPMINLIVAMKFGNIKRKNIIRLYSVLMDFPMLYIKAFFISCIPTYLFHFARRIKHLSIRDFQ